jgi:nucleoside-diphosphate-sugar epimerase
MNHKKVLVTGADGFIGSHLTEMLLEKGYPVKALAYYNSFNDWGWLKDSAASALIPITWFSLPINTDTVQRSSLPAAV